MFIVSHTRRLIIAFRFRRVLKGAVIIGPSFLRSMSHVPELGQSLPPAFARAGMPEDAVVDTPVLASCFRKSRLCTDRGTPLC